MLYRYKPDEGRSARQTAFWLSVGMLFFGCYSLSGTLVGIEALRGPIISGFEIIPLLGVRLSGAVAVATVVFLVSAFILMRYLGSESTAEHLIEVEQEMNKVTWPTFEDATNSSIVVVFTVAILMGFLAFSDFALARIFDVLLWGGLRG
ncbi:MAG: preprotein translocase subunit SecE [Planctomycetes bacterium]|nr:preprotein translocase subunit SecE [Planctomycetota bacterium]